MTVEAWKAWRDGTYEVSSLGQIRRVEATRTTPAGHVMRQHVDRITGYAIVGLRINGRRKTYSSHVVVAEVWIGPRPEVMVVDHIDGCRTNNRATNLRYLSHAENVLDGVRRSRRADTNRFAYNLSADDVKEIRAAHAAGVPVFEIAKRFHVHRTSITNVMRGHTWAHIGDAL